MNYHSAGQWLLYAEGWQIGTPTADDPIYYALSGNLDQPAIEGFHPGLSSDVLYVTNGETTDYAHASTGALAWTPELSEGCDGCGFVFPDDEALVQAEFERNLPFAKSVARSAPDPENPKSSLGIKTKPFYIKSDDPYKEGIPGANFTFKYSYGDPQPVRGAREAIARQGHAQVPDQRRPHAQRADVRVEGRREVRPRRHLLPPAPRDRARHRPRRLRARSGSRRRRRSADTAAAAWQEQDDPSDSFTYKAVSESGNRVLVVAAEDYTGASPVQASGPNYLSYYTDAARGQRPRRRTFTTSTPAGRTAPDQLGVLSHYDAVIWYTGDDAITRKAGWGPGNADRLALDDRARVAGVHERGRPGAVTPARTTPCSTRRTRARSSTTRRARARATPTRHTTRAAAWRCRAPVTA